MVRSASALQHALTTGRASPSENKRFTQTLRHGRAEKKRIKLERGERQKKKQQQKNDKALPGSPGGVREAVVVLVQQIKHVGITSDWGEEEKRRGRVEDLLEQQPNGSFPMSA
ncbi:hypothetical protein NQZ68_025300 [Dissostichus eleginoides]|nr:hypothetical protein NQZ68_025300 [Dissostichus eleginoides]